jgi:hypothetical protein
MISQRKIWLDDVRPAPEGWHWVLTPEEAIAWLKTHTVTEISLDHDLGVSSTGYNVAEYIYHLACVCRKIDAPKMWCHSMNVPGRKRIEQVINQIENYDYGN